MGLRYERQTNISSNYNFAPRLFFAWAPGGTSVGGGPGAPSSSSPKMVIRGGIGVFYDRFGERATLLANRFDGTNQLDFRVFDPQPRHVYIFAERRVERADDRIACRVCRAPDHAHIAGDFRCRRS